jgi:hypothetical protein
LMCAWFRLSHFFCHLWMPNRQRSAVAMTESLHQPPCGVKYLARLDDMAPVARVWHAASSTRTEAADTGVLSGGRYWIETSNTSVLARFAATIVERKNGPPPQAQNLTRRVAG